MNIKYLVDETSFFFYALSEKIARMAQEEMGRFTYPQALEIRLAMDVYENEIKKVNDRLKEISDRISDLQKRDPWTPEVQIEILNLENEQIRLNDVLESTKDPNHPIQRYLQAWSSNQAVLEAIIAQAPANDEAILSLATPKNEIRSIHDDIAAWLGHYEKARYVLMLREFEIFTEVPDDKLNMYTKGFVVSARYLADGYTELNNAVQKECALREQRSNAQLPEANALLDSVSKVAEETEDAADAIDLEAPLGHHSSVAQARIEEAREGYDGGNDSPQVTEAKKHVDYWAKKLKVAQQMRKFSGADPGGLIKNDIQTAQKYLRIATRDLENAKNGRPMVGKYPAQPGRVQEAQAMMAPESAVEQAVSPVVPKRKRVQAAPPQAAVAVSVENRGMQTLTAAELEAAQRQEQGPGILYVNRPVSSKHARHAVKGRARGVQAAKEHITNPLTEAEMTAWETILSANASARMSGKRSPYPEATEAMMIIDEAKLTPTEALSGQEEIDLKRDAIKEIYARLPANQRRAIFGIKRIYDPVELRAELMVGIAKARRERRKSRKEQAEAAAVVGEALVAEGESGPAAVPQIEAELEAAQRQEQGPGILYYANRPAPSRHARHAVKGRARGAQAAQAHIRNPLTEAELTAWNTFLFANESARMFGIRLPYPEVTETTMIIAEANLSLTEVLSGQKMIDLKRDAIMKIFTRLPANQRQAISGIKQIYDPVELRAELMAGNAKARRERRKSRKEQAEAAAVVGEALVAEGESGPAAVPQIEEELPSLQPLPPPLKSQRRGMDDASVRDASSLFASEPMSGVPYVDRPAWTAMEPQRPKTPSVASEACSDASKAPSVAPSRQSSKAPSLIHSGKRPRPAPAPLPAPEPTEEEKTRNLAKYPFLPVIEDGIRMTKEEIAMYGDLCRDKYQVHFSFQFLMKVSKERDDGKGYMVPGIYLDYRVMQKIPSIAQRYSRMMMNVDTGKYAELPLRGKGGPSRSPIDADLDLPSIEEPPSFAPLSPIRGVSDDEDEEFPEIEEPPSFAPLSPISGVEAEAAWEAPDPRQIPPLFKRGEVTAERIIREGRFAGEADITEQSVKVLEDRYLINKELGQYPEILLHGSRRKYHIGRVPGLHRSIGASAGWPSERVLLMVENKFLEFFSQHNMHWQAMDPIRNRIQKIPEQQLLPYSELANAKAIKCMQDSIAILKAHGVSRHVDLGSIPAGPEQDLAKENMWKGIQSSVRNAFNLYSARYEVCCCLCRFRKQVLFPLWIVQELLTNRLFNFGKVPLASNYSRVHPHFCFCALCSAFEETIPSKEI
jgi:hypothetical protein